MVKPSNKGKGKPSHRTTFKTKYKIERKVKQHRKKMQKEAKKLKGNGLKHKSTLVSDHRNFAKLIFTKSVPLQAADPSIIKVDDAQRAISTHN